MHSIHDLLAQNIRRFVHDHARGMKATIPMVLNGTSQENFALPNTMSPKLVYFSLDLKPTNSYPFSARHAGPQTIQPHFVSLAYSVRSQLYFSTGRSL